MNAKFHAMEADIIANAGQAGAVFLLQRTWQAVVRISC
ncbi:hypothetical protein ACLK1S_00640 [Escherichia coli]